MGRSVASYRTENKSQQRVYPMPVQTWPSIHSNWDQVKSSELVAVSLTTASHHTLSTEAEDYLAASLSRLQRPKEKICCANSMLQRAGSENQSNDHQHCQGPHGKTTALGHWQQVAAAEKENQDQKCYQPLVPEMLSFTCLKKQWEKSWFLSMSYVTFNSF